jgi:cytochrome P450
VPEFVTWVNALSPIFGLMEPEQIAAATRAIGELLTYVEKLVEQRSHAPADDLITSLLRAEDAGERLTRDETVTMVANLLVGGHDTTASQIACTLFALLDRPAALAESCGEPALLAALVAETLRFEPGITAAPRTVVQPLEIGGIARPAGTMVMLSFLSAHRDAAVWRDADTFQPRRFTDPSAPRLLAFGGGPHYCLGAALARMTIEEVVRAIAELAPKLTIDPESIEWVQVLGVAPAQLPVAL